MQYRSATTSDPGRFLPPARPVNRETLLEALEGPHEPQFEFLGARTTVDMKDFYAGICRSGEWFDFGPVPVEDAVQATEDAKPFVDAGLVELPHPITVFRMRLLIGRKTFEEALEGLDDPSRYVVPGGIELLFLCASGERIKLTTLSGAELPDLRFTVTLLRCDQGGGLGVVDTMGFDREGRTVHAKLGQGKTYRMLARSLMSAFFCLWLALNTKHIGKRVVEPPPKLNKARARAGKPPLQRVTYIDVAQYGRARQETERLENSSGRIPGTHASPRMHLRRAHLRHYADGKVVLIHAMIVNAHMDPALRASYKVKMETAQ